MSWHWRYWNSEKGSTNLVYSTKKRILNPTNHQWLCGSLGEPCPLVASFMGATVSPTNQFCFTLTEWLLNEPRLSWPWPSWDRKRKASWNPSKNGFDSRGSKPLNFRTHEGSNTRYPMYGPQWAVFSLLRLAEIGRVCSENWCEIVISNNFLATLCLTAFQ